MDLSKLKELAELMNRHQLEEVEIESEGERVRLRKPSEKSREIFSFGAPGFASVGATSPAASALAAPVSSAPAAIDPAKSILSPMVGTFYRAANPEAEAFVDVGDTIEEGKVLCIIEAMKVMNELRAEKSGVIAQILVESGAPVEFGQPLFRLA
ncbi:MAG: acetyl-CoA carboxylase biotin carboxyl carrier protein [Planctomycetota bacterium]